MERKVLIKIMFILFVAAVTVFSVVGISKAADPLTMDSLNSMSGFTDIGGNTANNTVNNTNTANKVNNTANSTKNNAAQSNTAIPKTGSNSVIIFISGMIVLATASIISISLYNRIKLQ